jgi:signal transduction histidine kinase
MFIAHLALIFSVQFIITGFLFFFKKQSKTGNRLLAATMWILAFQHFMHYMWASQRVYQYPWLLNIDVPLDTCIGPFLFFYIKVMVGEELKFRPASLLHFWPLSLGAVWYIYFNLQPAQFQVNFINDVYRNVPALAALVNIMIAVYLALGYKKLDTYIKNESNTQWLSGYGNLVWLRQFVVILFFINVGVAPLNLIAHFSYIMSGFPVLTGFILLFIVYKTFNHPEVMSTELLRKYNRQLEYHQEIGKVRRQISNDIHDELGAGLTQISMIGQLGKMENNPNPILVASYDKIINLSQNLMSTLREVVWSINPVHDNLNSLFLFLMQYINAFFEPSEIRILMEFPDDPEDVELDPYFRRNLILIVKEACNNVIKHAGASEVSFKCFVDQQKLVLMIKDNGCGLSDTKTVSGNGLKNIKKRAVEIGGSVEMISSPGEGVSLNIICPLSLVPQSSIAAK